MEDGKPHNLNIHVGITVKGQIYTGVDYGDGDGEGVEKHNITERTRTHTYVINEENLTNTVAIKLHKDISNTAKIFITDKPIGQTSGDHNAREVSQKAGEEISITVEGEEKKIYAHAITNGIKDLYTKHLATLKDKKNPFGEAEAALTAYEKAQAEVATAKDDLATAEKKYSDAIYDALLKMSKAPLPDYSSEYYNIAMSDGDGSNEKENHGLIITLKNMEQFFGFDAGKVKDSVRASYIAYYCLVWGSFVGYAFYNWKQLWNNKEFSMKIVPFLVAAVVETLLIGQSHYSLNESDVASNSGEASPTFNYAIAGFSTRIATVVAFLSTILSQVKD